MICPTSAMFCPISHKTSCMTVDARMRQTTVHQRTGLTYSPGGFVGVCGSQKRQRPSHRMRFLHSEDWRRRNEVAAFFVRWRWLWIFHAPCWNSSGGEWCPTVLYSLLLLLLYSYVSKSIQKWKPISFHFSFRSMLDRSRCDKNPIWSDHERTEA